MKQANYLPPNRQAWQGRIDSSAAERYHQQINCVDLSKQALPQGAKIALLGFCSDVGVVRNLGRPGSQQGPASVRRSLANLALAKPGLYDVGDVVVCDDELETAQSALAELVARLLQQGVLPIVIGGGHETAWGHYLGINQALPTVDLQFINFDAHFDLRQPIVAGQGTSGTPFYQIAEARQAEHKPFTYTCLGIQAASNTATLFATADQLGVNYLQASQIMQMPIAAQYAFLQPILEQPQAIYLSLCLDVFAQAFAPGVSAPQALGLAPWHVWPLLKTILASGKVISVDVVELSPVFDRDQQTEKLAASLINEVIVSCSE